ncbi:MAG: HlyD family type I secretion periplasmic adaptor subunit, partial [Alphaproteobacteria bacterium]
RITAFSMRNAKPLKGRVMSVSADRLIDERTGQAYYRARIELTENPAKAFEGATLYPGMPAEVMIVTGARTALGYIFNPISSSFNRAFREQ